MAAEKSRAGTLGWVKNVTDVSGLQHFPTPPGLSQLAFQCNGGPVAGSVWVGNRVTEVVSAKYKDKFTVIMTPVFDSFRP